MNGSDGFPVPSAAERARWLSELGDREAHHRIAEGLACLSSVDVEHPPARKPAGGWLRVAAWNLEARRPTVVPAVAPDGTPLSDHDLVAASIRLERT